MVNTACGLYLHKNNAQQQLSNCQSPTSLTIHSKKITGALCTVCPLNITGEPGVGRGPGVGQGIGQGTAQGTQPAGILL